MKISKQVKRIILKKFSPLTREGTMTPEASEAIDPEREDSISDWSLWAKGLPRNRLCLAWDCRFWPLRLTKDVQDWKPDSWPRLELGGPQWLFPVAEVARVWPPSEDERAKWLGVKYPGVISRFPKLLRLPELEAARGCTWNPPSSGNTVVFF